MNFRIVGYLFFNIPITTIPKDNCNNLLVANNDFKLSIYQFCRLEFPKDKNIMGN